MYKIIFHLKNNTFAMISDGDEIWMWVGRRRVLPHVSTTRNEIIALLQNRQYLVTVAALIKKGGEEEVLSEDEDHWTALSF